MIELYFVELHQNLNRLRRINFDPNQEKAFRSRDNLSRLSDEDKRDRFHASDDIRRSQGIHYTQSTLTLARSQTTIKDSKQNQKDNYLSTM